ncbi:hypothetical protein PTKIN_Ptkin11bG0186300 [Pterospermum kingtungense]
MNHYFTQLDDDVSADVETALSFITVVATVVLSLLLHVLLLRVLWRFCCSCYRNHVKKYLSSSSSAGKKDPLKIAAVEKILNYKFKDKRLLEKALTHSSRDNERLEFLGDAALGLMVATHFFRLEHKLNSDDLTELQKMC